MSAAEELLAALDPEQRQVAEALRGPVRVLAGAGTGKTRAITHRIAYGVASGLYAPTEVLAVTFTTRAAGEMRGRLRALGTPTVQARTFHSAALRQLRYFWPHVYGRDLPTLTESKIGLLAQAARQVRLPVDQAVLRDLASEVEWAKVSNVHPDDYAVLAAARDRSVSGHDLDTVGRVFAAYESAKREAGRMDMEDVLLLAAGMLADDERVSAQVRRQYKWFVVDEFQDVSPLQSALLDLWLGGRHDVCVVGDPAQTIYSFAGARDSYLREFSTKHPDTTSLELRRNYRSTPAVVGFANAVLAGSPSAGVTLQAQRTGGPEPALRGQPDEVAEAEAVAAEMQRLAAAGTPYGAMAVLIRINAQSEQFEEALTARGIPYSIRGAARFFERPEVREAVTRLRGAARGGEGSDDLVADVRSVLAAMGWSETAPTSRGQTRDRWESWQALMDQSVAFAESAPNARLGDFVDELDRRAGEQHAPVADSVTIATFHAAKGLEWEAVFCCGVHEGMLPIVYAESALAVEEERRLLYVGVTRARTRLWVSWARTRNPGGRGNRPASRFLTSLLPAEEPPRAKNRSRKVARCRGCGGPLDTPAEKKLGRCGDCPATYDEELFERLREWRLNAGERGQGAGVRGVHRRDLAADRRAKAR